MIWLFLLAMVRLSSRDVGAAVVSKFGDKIHWLDNGSEHPHRVAFSVNFYVMEDVIGELRRRFDDSGVQVCPLHP